MAVQNGQGKRGRRPSRGGFAQDLALGFATHRVQGLRTTVYLLTFLRCNVPFSLQYEEHVEKRKQAALVISSYQIKRPWHSLLVYSATVTNRLKPSDIPNCSSVAIINFQALITMLFQMNSLRDFLLRIFHRKIEEFRLLSWYWLRFRHGTKKRAPFLVPRIRFQWFSNTS